MTSGNNNGQHNQQPNIIINNTNTMSNMNVGGYGPGPKNKWIAFFLCLFLVFFGAHKFYEGKMLLGIVYFFTAGIFLIGVVVDLFSLIFKPNPYYV